MHQMDTTVHYYVRSAMLKRYYRHITKINSVAELKTASLTIWIICHGSS